LRAARDREVCWPVQTSGGARVCSTPATAWASPTYGFSVAWASYKPINGQGSWTYLAAGGVSPANCAGICAPAAGGGCSQMPGSETNHGRSVRLRPGVMRAGAAMAAMTLAATAPVPAQGRACGPTRWSATPIPGLAGPARRAMPSVGAWWSGIAGPGSASCCHSGPFPGREKVPRYAWRRISKVPARVGRKASLRLRHRRRAAP